MLAKIAEAIEPHRPAHIVREALKDLSRGDRVSLADLIAFSVETALEHISPAAVFVPTRSGYTARSIARFRLPVWIAALSSLEATCQRLQFSYGVYPIHEPDHPEDWRSYIKRWLQDHEVDGDLVVLTEGPSTKHPEANNRMEIIDLRPRSKKT
jgi:pyruvate kinase